MLQNVNSISAPETLVVCAFLKIVYKKNIKFSTFLLLNVFNKV